MSARPRRTIRWRARRSSARAVLYWPKPLRISATFRSAIWAPSAGASPTPIRLPITQRRLLALEAKLVLVSAKSQREIPIAQFFVDTFTTELQPGEIIREVVVPVEDQSTGTSYQKMVQPASGFALVGVAARVRKAGGKVTMARVGVTGLSGKPYRAASVEKALEGTAGSASDIQKAAASVADGVDANSDLHASADYRKHLARIYTMRALTLALSRTA